MEASGAFVDVVDPAIILFAVDVTVTFKARRLGFQLHPTFGAL